MTTWSGATVPSDAFVSPPLPGVVISPTPPPPSSSVRAPSRAPGARFAFWSCAPLGPENSRRNSSCSAHAASVSASRECGDEGFCSSVLSVNDQCSRSAPRDPWRHRATTGESTSRRAATSAAVTSTKLLRIVRKPSAPSPATPAPPSSTAYDATSGHRSSSSGPSMPRGSATPTRPPACASRRMAVLNSATLRSSERSTSRASSGEGVATIRPTPPPAHPDRCGASTGEASRAW
mmetsp:Transcript_3844/g.8045  ORF Transcript_3844/g.8045 Transcript_3844/m.8045 type:complete len:235 (+) Transcript_3844:844-1548(+)